MPVLAEEATAWSRSPGPSLAARSLYSHPPPAQDALANNPTLLVSWWCTIFSLAIILVRLSGRWIRTEKLYREDKIMALAILPLLARMAFVHVVLRFGTNNTVLTGLSADDILRRELGSKLVLPARIMDAAFLWLTKLTVVEFLHRLFSQFWKRSWNLTLVAIRVFLLLGFVAIFVATLSECRPFPHYFQVVPDPGPQCRQAMVQLLVMGIADGLSNVLLVAFPVHVVLQSNLPNKRKLSLCLLFGLAVGLVGLTIFRLVRVIQADANQQFRSLLASLEILAAAFNANALILGSFIRDRGAKKRKFKPSALADLSEGGGSSLDPPTSARLKQNRPQRRPSSLDSDDAEEDDGFDSFAREYGIYLGSDFVAEEKKAALLLQQPEAAALPDRRSRLDGSVSKETYSRTTANARGSSSSSDSKSSIYSSDDIESPSSSSVEKTAAAASSGQVLESSSNHSAVSLASKDKPLPALPPSKVAKGLARARTLVGHAEERLRLYPSPGLARSASARSASPSMRRAAILEQARQQHSRSVSATREERAPRRSSSRGTNASREDEEEEDDNEDDEIREVELRDVGGLL